MSLSESTPQVQSLDAEHAPAAAAPPRRRRRKWLFGLAAFLLVGGSLGAYLGWSLRASIPPDISLDGLEPEVATTIREARAGVLQTPRSGAAWGLLGQALLANEVHLDSSVRCFLEAERLDPQNPSWPYLAAVALLSQGKQQEALPELQQAINLSEQSEDASSTPRLLLAETLAFLEQPADAESHFLHVLAAEPSNVRAHFGLGLLAYAQGRWQASRTHLEACLGSPQARKKASAQLAVACARLNDKVSSEKYATRAARLPNDFGWTDPFLAAQRHLARRQRDRFRRVDELAAERRFDEAAAVLAQLLDDYPNDYLAHLMMGRILPQAVAFQLAGLQQAEQHLHRALQLAPDKIEGRYLLGLVLFKQGEALAAAHGDPQKVKALFEESVRHSREALALKPDYGFAHMSLGLALKGLGRRHEALAAFRQAVHCNPEYAENHLLLGMALGQEGHIAEACACLKEAVLLAGPNDPRPRTELNNLGCK